jgi:hypothetical protein
MWSPTYSSSSPSIPSADSTCVGEQGSRRGVVVLCCTALHCTALHCAALHCALCCVAVPYLSCAATSVEPAKACCQHRPHEPIRCHNLMQRHVVGKEVWLAGEHNYLWNLKGEGGSDWRRGRKRWCRCSWSEVYARVRTHVHVEHCSNTLSPSLHPTPLTHTHTHTHSHTSFCSLLL